MHASVVGAGDVEAAHVRFSNAMSDRESPHAPANFVSAVLGVDEQDLQVAAAEFLT